MKTLSSIILAIITTFFVVLFWLVYASLAPLDGEVDVEDIGQDIEIVYDQYQRPFVNANSLDDALYAQGFLHGSHRLWQMELFRKAAQGQLSTVFGPSLLETDKELWRIGVPTLANTLFNTTTKQNKHQVSRYVSGINKAIENYSVAPVEFLLLDNKVEPWTEKDVYAVGALLAFQTANNHEKELIRLALQQQLDVELAKVFLPHDEQPSEEALTAVSHRNDLVKKQNKKQNKSLYSKDLVAVIDDLERTNSSYNSNMPRLAFGSNSFVVSSEKSASKNALFAFDSHDNLGLPNLYYELHMFFEHEQAPRQIRGWSIAGMPGVINGYNESIAWGFTNIGDTQDLFLETAHPTEPHTFKDGDSWYKATTTTVDISVKGSTKKQQLTLVTTKNGVLISENPAISLRWTIQDIGDKNIDAILALNLARNWTEFNHASNLIAAPTLNASYADNEGNIGLRTVGLLPIRGVGKGLVPVDGSIPKNRWKGIVADKDMPRLFNPDSGFIAAANANQNAPKSGVLISADNAPAYRFNRISQVLSKPSLLTIDDLQNLQNDWYDQQAAKLLPVMLAELNSKNAVSVEVQKIVVDWLQQPIADEYSQGALIYQLWYKNLAKTLFSSKLEKPLLNKVLSQKYLVNHALDYLLLDDIENPWWQHQRSKFITEAFDLTMKQLTKLISEDTDRWYLAKLHTVQLQHEIAKEIEELEILLNSNKYATGGSTNTVGNTSYKYNDSLAVTHGATLRVTAELAKEISVNSVISGGQSGHPLSPNYDDQFSLWLDKELLKVPENSAKIEKSSGKTTLKRKTMSSNAVN